MYLKSLELTGFKSFAKKGELEFNSSITAIVGPNGSGKSNVAEAFRFVLGEQSIKSLRGKKGEDLIFNGGKSLPKMNKAGVKLLFDNRKRILDIDFDEVTLERVVHRDGVNEYLINGSQVRLRDIIELLSGAHIGASGHHIISQGEADRILNANIKERREMIEEALGLKIYHYKKQESEKKLEKTEENIKQVESLRKEIAPHIKFLQKQVEKVEKAREMKEELKGIYKEYLKREDEYLKFHKEWLNNAKKGPLEKKAKLEKELKEAKDILTHSSGKDKKSEELLKLEEKIGHTRKEKDTLMHEIGRVEGSVTSLERTIEKQKELLNSEENKMVPLREVEDMGTRLSREVEELKDEKDLNIIKKAFIAVRDSLVSFVTKYKAQSHNTFTDDAETEIKKLQDERKKCDVQMRDLDRDEKTFAKEYGELKNEIEKEKDSNRDAEKSVFRIMAEQNEVIGILHSLKAEEDKFDLIETDFKRELQEGGVLIGREIVDFQAVEVRDSAGVVIGREAIAGEARSAQDERRRKIEKIKIRLEDAGIGTGEEIMKEFKEAEERDQFLAREIADLEKSAESLRGLILELTTKLDVEFKEGVHKINAQFNEFFALMFGGGTAALEVIREKKKKKEIDLELLDDEAVVQRMDEEEEGQEGIEINVSLPHKRIKGLVMLSGGERALTSIALLFAISQVNPPPFIILDETDAALDEANSKKYGNMIENLSKYSQLILITHNRETMSRAGVLYGVTMGAEGFSKLLSVQFDEAVAVAK